jgi:hypothetical protein
MQHSMEDAENTGIASRCIFACRCLFITSVYAFFAGKIERIFTEKGPCYGAAPE